MSEIIFSPQQTLALDAIAAGASITQVAADFRIALANAQYDRALLSDAPASPSVRLKAALAIVHLVTVPITFTGTPIPPLPQNPQIMHNPAQPASAAPVQPSAATIPKSAATRSASAA